MGNATINNPDTETILIMLRNIAMTMDFVMGVLTWDTNEIISLAIGGLIILLIMLLTGIFLKLIRDVKLDFKDLREEMKEIKEMVKPKAPGVTPEQEMRMTVASAVTDAMQTSFGQLLSQLQMKPLIPAFQQTGPGVGIQAGVQYHGTTVAVRPNT